MIILVLCLLFSAGAVCAYWIPSRYRSVHIAVALIPGLAFAALLLRLPLPAVFTLPWQPAALFPDSLSFKVQPAAVIFAGYFCGLLFMLEWTRPLRPQSGRGFRSMVFLLTLAGCLACFAANPLSILLAWSLIDFLSLLAIAFSNPPVEIAPSGVSATLNQAMVVFAANMLGSILVFFSLFITAQSEAPVSLPVSLGSGISFALFLLGVAIRLLASPVHFSFLRNRRKSIDTEILLRTVSPATALCLLAIVWPEASGGFAGLPWMVALLVPFLLWAAWRWFASPIPYDHRDQFFLVLPGFALVCALLVPQATGLFLAAGGVLILGGGTLMVYLGFLKHRPWLAAFPGLLAVFSAGIPFTPMSIWPLQVYSGLMSSAQWVALFFVAAIHLFLVAALFRTALDPVDEFPSNEPVFLISFSIGMAAGLLGMLYPGWLSELGIGSILIPVLLLSGAGGAVYLLRRLQRSAASRWPLRGQTVRLDWITKSAAFVFQSAAAAVSGVESFLSGEGAMLWSLGIALLLYLMFRGG
jgi:hypothetical protein